MQNAVEESLSICTVVFLAFLPGHLQGPWASPFALLVLLWDFSPIVILHFPQCIYLFGEEEWSQALAWWRHYLQEDYWQGYPTKRIFEDDWCVGIHDMHQHIF